MAALASLFVEFRASTSAFASDMRDISKEVNAFNRDLKPTTDRLKDFGKVATAVGTGLTAAVSLPLIGIGASAIKAASDFQSSFAGINKTVDGVTDAGGKLTEFGLQLQQQFRDMAKTIPISVNELNRIGEAAGQIGIKKENIAGFSKVMAELGVTTNLTSDQAATSLARLANITKMPQDAFDRLGATVVALGNAGASTESEIVEFGLRIAGAGAQVGLTEAQILSFGSALASVGINAEAGGTAISKVFIEIASAAASGGKKLEQFAAVAGMSAADFKKAFQDDAAGATVSFVEGLGKISKEGGNVFGVLDEMGLSEVRVRDAMLRASGAGDLLRESIKTGTQAWKENSALTTEATKRYATFDSQLKIFKNQLNDVAITLGTALLPAFTSILEAAKPLIAMLGKVAAAFAALPSPVQTFIIAMAGIAIAVGPVLLGIGLMTTGLVNLAPAVIGVIAAMKSVAVITGFGSALTGIQLLAQVRSFGDLTAAVSLFKGTLVSLPLLASVRSFSDLNAAISLIGQTSLVAKLGLAGLAAGVGIAIGMFVNWIVKITGLQDSLDRLIKKTVELIPIVGKWATGQNAVTQAMEGLTAAQKKMVEELNRRNIVVDLNRLADAKYVAGLGAQVKAQTAAEQATKSHTSASKGMGAATKAASDEFANISKVLSGSTPKIHASADAIERLTDVQQSLKTDMETITNAVMDWNAELLKEQRQLAAVDRALDKAAESNRIYARSMREISDAVETANASLKNLPIPAMNAANELLMIKPPKVLLPESDVKKVSEQSKAFAQAWATAIANLNTRIAEDLAEIIVEGGEFGTRMIKIAKDTAKGMLSAFLSGLISPLTDAFAKLGQKAAGILSDNVLSRLPGFGASAAGTAASGAGSVGSAVGGIGGGGGGVAGAASGVAGTVTAVAGVVNALGSIGGIFQMKRLEGTMNAVEENTRYTQVQLKDTMEQILWPQFNLVNWIALQSNAIVAQLGSIYETLSTPDRSSSGVAVPSVAAQNQAVAAPNITVTYGDIIVNGATGEPISSLIEKLKRALQTNQDGLAAEILRMIANQQQGLVARG